MNSNEFVDYVAMHAFEKYCSGCKQWKGNDQETYSLCCYEMATVQNTLLHIQMMAEEIHSENNNHVVGQG